MGQPATESSSSGTVDTDSSSRSGSGATEEVISEQVEVPAWTITEPPPAIKSIEYDSAGRRITPITAEERAAKTIAQEVEDLQKS